MFSVYLKAVTGCLSEIRRTFCRTAVLHFPSSSNTKGNKFIQDQSCPKFQMKRQTGLPGEYSNYSDNLNSWLNYRHNKVIGSHINFGLFSWHNETVSRAKNLPQKWKFLQTKWGNCEIFQEINYKQMVLLIVWNIDAKVQPAQEVLPNGSFHSELLPCLMPCLLLLVWHVMNLYKRYSLKTNNWIWKPFKNWKYFFCSIGNYEIFEPLAFGFTISK